MVFKALKHCLMTVFNVNVTDIVNNRQNAILTITQGTSKIDLQRKNENKTWADFI
jgi:hypothetical protein